MIKPNKNNKNPCPMSPNITPNKKGKVTVVNNDGLASRYLATPYVSTIYWAERVYEFFWNNVGFFLLLPGTFY